MNISALLHEIDAEIERLQTAKALLSAVTMPKKRGRPAKAASIPSSAPARKRRALSEEARARMAEAQRKRWAAQKNTVPAKKMVSKKAGAKKAPAKVANATL